MGDETLESQTEQPVQTDTAQEQTSQKVGFFGRIGSFFKSAAYGLCGAVAEMFSYIPCCRQVEGLNNFSDKMLTKAGDNLKTCVGGENIAYDLIKASGQAAIAPITGVSTMGEIVANSAEDFKEGNYTKATLGLGAGVATGALSMTPIGGVASMSVQGVAKAGQVALTNGARRLAVRKGAEYAAKASQRTVGILRGNSGCELTSDESGKGSGSTVVEYAVERALGKVI